MLNTCFLKISFRNCSFINSKLYISKGFDSAQPDNKDCFDCHTERSRSVPQINL